MKPHILILLLPSLLLWTGCRQEHQVARPPVAVVQNILSGSESALGAVLKAYDPAGTDGDIAIVDSPLRAAMLSEAFLVADTHDNIDGSAASDRLPDFAGERVVALMDTARDDYAQMDSITLREVAVRSMLAAMDTACCIASFDTEYRSSKPRAKVVIMSSPEMQAVAAYDIDTLLRASSVTIPVICPARMMIGGLVSDGVRRIGIITDGLSALSGAYDIICADYAAAEYPVECYAVASDDLVGQDPLAEFLHSYKDAGNTAPIDALVLDTYEYTSEGMLSAYARMLLEDTRENVEVRGLVSNSFRVVDAATTATQACYTALRERNLFTHDIHYPEAAAYLTNPEMSQYALMLFDWNSLPSGLESDLMNTAPKTYIAYVQNQHVSGRN